MERLLILGIVVGFISKQLIVSLVHHKVVGVIVLHAFCSFLCFYLFSGYEYYLYYFIVCICLFIAYVDAYTMDIYHYSLIILCFLVSLTFFKYPIDWTIFIVIWLLFIGGIFFSKKTQMIGEGDIYLIFIMSLLLRYRVFLGINIACISAFLYVGITKKREPFPFAPFLCLGFILTILNFI